MQLLNADCIEAMKTMADNSVDSIVTDPPYELGFMGKSWDASGIAFNIEVWQQALRVLKPGGHLIAFSGSRTYHRMAVAIEDAGFQIRDQIMWVYGSGFPKSLNISKAIDGQMLTGKSNSGAIRFANENRPGEGRIGASLPVNGIASDVMAEARVTNNNPSTDEAKQWDGWGTALKPAHESMVLARKPVEGTVANNVLTHGVGGLNIDASRVPSDDGFEKAWDKPVRTNISAQGGKYISEGSQHTVDLTSNRPIGGRFPANFIHDGIETEWSKFFYCAKASKHDRNEGLDGFELKKAGIKNESGRGFSETDPHRKIMAANHHPTVKPTSLMQYLVRLVTPEGGLVLDPFMGSGSTGKACAYEGFDFIGIDQSADYVEIARARIAFAQADDE